MLADVLQGVPWEQVTDGVMLYRFTPDAGLALGEYPTNRKQSARQRINLFLCCSGALTLRRAHGEDIEIGPEEITLLSDISDLVSIVVRQSPVGYCLVIDPEGCSAFSGINHVLGCVTWSYAEVQALLQKHGGYWQIKHSLWKQSVFSILESLPDEEQGTYCVLKAAELCYLFRAYRSMYNDIAKQLPMADYITELLLCIGTYIENHLDEKLTISMLCHRFNLSPTTLKNKFREFYGQSIHNWIQYRRIHRAAELLRSTNMTVLQVSHSVGYESVSQFNAVFRRTYGTTPSRYKKCLIPQEMS